MTPQETTVLLGFIQGLDNRFVPDQKTISAWMNVIPASISLSDAMEYVREHYLEHDRSVMPANIVGRHRMRVTPDRVVKPKPSHDCLDGWVMVVEVQNGQEYSAASRCPQCQPNSVRLKS